VPRLTLRAPNRTATSSKPLPAAHRARNHQPQVRHRAQERTPTQTPCEHDPTTARAPSLCRMARSWVPWYGARMRLTATRGSHPTPKRSLRVFRPGPYLETAQLPSLRARSRGDEDMATRATRVGLRLSSGRVWRVLTGLPRVYETGHAPRPVGVSHDSRDDAPAPSALRGSTSPGSRETERPPPRRPWPRTTERQAAAAASTEFQAACPSRRCHRSVIPHVWLPPFRDVPSVSCPEPAGLSF
jgi:hypothetical protein